MLTTSLTSLRVCLSVHTRNPHRLRHALTLHLRHHLEEPSDLFPFLLRVVEVAEQIVEGLKGVLLAVHLVVEVQLRKANQKVFEENLFLIDKVTFLFEVEEKGAQ